MTLPRAFILHANDAPPVPIPPGHRGPMQLPGTGRTVYWTGRVAIGIRHQPQRAQHEPVAHSALWVQDLFLDGHLRKAAA